MIEQVNHFGGGGGVSWRPHLLAWDSFPHSKFISPCHPSSAAHVISSQAAKPAFRKRLWLHLVKLKLIRHCILRTGFGTTMRRGSYWAARWWAYEDARASWWASVYGKCRMLGTFHWVLWVVAVGRPWAVGESRRLQDVSHTPSFSSFKLVADLCAEGACSVWWGQRS